MHSNLTALAHPLTAGGFRAGEAGIFHPRGGGARVVGERWEVLVRHPCRCRVRHERPAWWAGGSCGLRRGMWPGCGWGCPGSWGDRRVWWAGGSCGQRRGLRPGCGWGCPGSWGDRRVWWAGGSCGQRRGLRPGCGWGCPGSWGDRPAWWAGRSYRLHAAVPAGALPSATGDRPAWGLAGHLLGRQPAGRPHDRARAVSGHPLDVRRVGGCCRSGRWPPAGSATARSRLRSEEVERLPRRHRLRTEAGHSGAADRHRHSPAGGVWVTSRVTPASPSQSTITGPTPLPIFVVSFAVALKASGFASTILRSLRIWWPG